MADENISSGNQITCDVCFRHCVLKDGQTGFCRARRNEGGKNKCLNYGIITSLALDPIEKKPLAMFMPGSYVLSIGSFGCNLRCPYCQNYEISQEGPEEAEGARQLSPEILAALALREKQNNNIGIAYTYNEPSIGYEFIRDTAKLVHEAGMKNVLVTNGSITERALNEFLPYIDAMNIDLKAFTKDYYDWIGGDIETVKRFIECSVASGVHVEITELILPSKNDSEEETESLAAWLSELSPDIPLHITRSFPRWKEDSFTPPSPDLIRALCAAAGKHLNHVFAGNI